MSQLYKVPLVLSPQPEGGYTVTSPVLPELITEGNSLEEVMENVRDALQAAVEIYHDLNKPLPAKRRATVTPSGKREVSSLLRDKMKVKVAEPALFVQRLRNRQKM